MLAEERQAPTVAQTRPYLVFLTNSVLRADAEDPYAPVWAALTPTAGDETHIASPARSTRAWPPAFTTLKGGTSSNSPATQAPRPLPTPALISDGTTNLLRTLRPATDPGPGTTNNNGDNNNDDDDADGLQAPFPLQVDNLISVLADRAAPANLRYTSMRLALVTETLEIETAGAGVARVTHRRDGLQGEPLRVLPESRRELNG
ncbi:hypothetical protein VTG60DRAFT_591 [Thermothelomyces hinnuleus]